MNVRFGPSRLQRAVLGLRENRVGQRVAFSVRSRECDVERSVDVSRERLRGSVGGVFERKLPAWMSTAES